MDNLEQEQIEELRHWWSDYGNYVIAGVVLGVIGLFGYNYYHSSRLDQAYVASGLYDDLVAAIEDADLTAAESIRHQIADEFPHTAYAAQADLGLARLYMDQSRDQDAADTLQRLVDGDAEPEFRQVARLRLAKIFLYQDKPDAALELLGTAGPDDGAFAARFDEVRGDAHVALEQPDVAREDYRRALSEAGSQATVNREFVQLKLLDLPVEEVPEANHEAGAAAPAEEAPAPAGAPLEPGSDAGAADDAAGAPKEGE